MGESANQARSGSVQNVRTMGVTMTSTAPPPTPAGWYSDPSGNGQLRWWDGARWTEHVTALPPVASAAQPVYGAQGYDAQVYGPQNYGAMTMESATPTHWNTVSVWFLVFSYLLVGIVVAVALPVGLAISGAAAGYSVVGALVVILIVALALAFGDRRALLSFGFERPASPWWILFLPIAGVYPYLIARTVRVRREAGRGGAPLWTALALLAAILVGVVPAVPVFLNQQGSAQRAQFEAQVTRGLDSRGGNYLLTCPQQFSLSIGSHFSCTAEDSNSQSIHVLSIEVVAGVNGAPTVKLDSVTPPITQ
jgi:Protein of unknown function (DUF2510)